MTKQGNIHFGGRDYRVPADRVDEIMANLVEVSRRGKSSQMTVTDSDGEVTHLLWTPGAPIAISVWDVSD